MVEVPIHLFLEVHVPTHQRSPFGHCSCRMRSAAHGGGKRAAALIRTESLRPDAAQHHRHRSDVDSHTRMSDPLPHRVLPCPNTDDGT
jgi:hypothetical protein